MNIGYLLTRLAVLLIVFAGLLPARADDGEPGEDEAVPQGRWRE